MLVLTDEEQSRLLAPAEILAAVAAAALALDQGTATVPPRLHVEHCGNTLLAMPAASASAFGTKLVSVFPGNAGRGLPVITGLMVLNDAATGQPLALLNAAGLTARRTGAVGALGIKHRTPADLDSVGIVGAGVQGAWQAIFACAVRPIREIFVVTRSPERLAEFRSTVLRGAPGVKITVCRGARELLERTHLVIAATTSATPVLPDEPALLEGKHFISVGSFRPAMQELPDAVYRLAGELAIDSDFARPEVGDIVNPRARGLLRAENIYPIAAAISGRRSVTPGRTTAYKTAGMALFDLFVAEALYAAARTAGIGREIEI